MSAVLPYLERKPSERGKKDSTKDMDVIIHEEDIDSSSDIAGVGLGKVGGKVKNPPLDADGTPLHPLQKPHTELTRLLWARTLIAKALVGAKFKLSVEQGQVTVVADPLVTRDTISWSFSSKDLRQFSLFSSNSKMDCPTFDLPAGIGQLGGACPGAAFAQSTVPTALLETTQEGEVVMTEKLRKALGFLIDSVQKDCAHLPHEERPAKLLNLNTTVCTRCYASGGKYGEAVVQFAEVARYSLVQSMLAQNESGLVDLLVRVIEETLTWDKLDSTRHGIRPIRVHSSGDFFSQKYASMWLKVAQQLHQNAQDAKKRGDRDYEPVLLWAPTRTHVLAHWVDFWEENRKLGVKTNGKEGIPPNFIIRPSAYSVGDPAPFIKRPSPTGSKGTSVLFSDDTRARIVKKNGAEHGDGTKFDFQCGVYALGGGEKTCLKSTAPDGKIGCRACWKRPEMAVNYVIH